MKQTIEKYFGMSFKNIVEKLNHEEGRSVLWLSKQCGISRDTLYKIAKKEGLAFTSASQSATNKYKHHTHWATGLTKENSSFALMHSERMKEKNPSNSPLAMGKRAVTMQATFLKINLPQEAAFAKVLDEIGLEYERQTPVGKYNLDFFIRSMSLDIEIDSTHKWGKEKRLDAARRDKYLLRRGIRTLRINKNLLDRRDVLAKILEANNIVRKS